MKYCHQCGQHLELGIENYCPSCGAELLQQKKVVGKHGGGRDNVDSSISIHDTEDILGAGFIVVLKP